MNEKLTLVTEKDPKPYFKQKLNNILYAKISVENINRFAEDALEDLVNLNEEVVRTYERDYSDSSLYTGAKLEDKAYEAYGLENLNTILTRITSVRDNIQNIAEAVIDSIHEIDRVITTPDTTPELIGNGEGGGGFEAPKQLDRLVTLAYILERDFDLNQDDVVYIKGITTDNMMRQEPYVRVEVKDLERVVYICDEEGNASYVFDVEVLEHLGIDIDSLDTMTKSQRNTLIEASPTVGKRIIQSPKWREIMYTALSTSFSELQIEETQNHANRSEFSEKPELLKFVDFQTEVREAYEKAESPVNVTKWYKVERFKHPNWPSKPEQKYQNSGWISYRELVQKLLPFTAFQVEVKSAYEKAESPVNIGKWYVSERFKHPNWPSTPHEKYKNSGWVGFPALVGKETVEFLPFTAFQVEVKSAYEKAESPVNIINWYKKELPEHSNWPSTPHSKYQDLGWVSYPDLVKKETVEFLPFTAFQVEVKSAYEKAESPVNIGKWYLGEKSKHPNWPVAPDQKYRNSGWVGFPELVGKKNGNSKKV